MNKCVDCGVEIERGSLCRECFMVKLNKKHKEEEKMEKKEKEEWGHEL